MTTANPLLRAALFYAERMQWSVFPLKPKAKEPLTPHGYKDATLDPQQIRQWWKQWPQANIGIPTGRSFWVIDIDPRNGGEEALQALVARHDALPDTIQQMSGGGGRHYLFAPAKHGVRSGHLASGIDIKGKGGYIVVAPSIHPSGRAYIWDGARPVTEQALLPAPTWLLVEIETARNGTTGPDPLPERIPKGEQHSTLVSIAGSMRNRGLGADEIFAALTVINRERCTEPGPEENIRQIAESVCQYRPGKILPEEASPAEPRARPAAKPGFQLVVKDAAEIYAADFPEPQPIVAPILYAGLTLLAGRTKIGKSWLGLDLSLALVQKQKFAGFLNVNQPVQVLYVSLEERPRQTRGRLHQLTPPGDFLKNLKFIHELPALMAGGAGVLDRELAAHPAGVVIVDSLLALSKQAARGHVDAMQADYNIVATLREVTERNRVALVLICHTRKAAGDYFVDLVQGTTGTTAAADAVWVLTKTGDGSGTLHVTGREVEDRVYGLTRQGPLWKIQGEGEAFTQTEDRSEVIELLRENGPMKPMGVARALQKRITTVQKLLRRMLDDGLVVRQQYGQYQLLGSVKAK